MGKNISHNEAQLFNKLAQFLFYYSDYNGYILFNNIELLYKYEFPFFNIVILQDTGLINSNTMISLSLVKNLLIF